MLRLVTVVTLGLLLAGCSTGSDQTSTASAADHSAPPAFLAGTESRVITSATTERTYQVSVALPRGYDGSAETYPVLYALDANGEFGIVVETARLLATEGQIPELVIVGIGYPVGYFLDAVDDRGVDLTLTEDPDFQENWQRLLSGFPMPPSTGGAPGFLSFLTDELIPLVDAEYRVSPGDRALFGHSLGGLFATYAMLHSDGALHRFIAASPTLSWDDRVIFEQEAAYAAANDVLSARVFFSVGLLEPDAPLEEHPWAGYITNLREFTATLESREYDGFEYTAYYFEDETHSSGIPSAVSKGLRYIYARD